MSRPNIKVGMFLRHIRRDLKKINLEDIDWDSILDHTAGALVRDMGSVESALLVYEMRRRVIDTRLSPTTLAKYIRPK